MVQSDYVSYKCCGRKAGGGEIPLRDLHMQLSYVSYVHSYIQYIAADRAAVLLITTYIASGKKLQQCTGMGGGGL